MRRFITAPLVIAMVGVSTVASAEVSIDIPNNNTAVCERNEVGGKVSDEPSPVWVVIHPFPVSTFYVQPRTTVSGDRWRTTAYFGRPGSVDVGVEFEIRAFSAPEASLKEGQMLDDWPKARSSSNTVQVKRRAC